MPATPKDLFDRLAALEIAVTTHEHPPLHTVEESKALRGSLPGGHCKNLYLRDRRKRNWLLVTLEDLAVDLKALPERIGSDRLSFGSPDRLMEFLGVRPGSVTPFALINDGTQRVEVVLQAALFDHALLNFHPLVNTMTCAIGPDDLVRFIEACGHSPRIVEL